jgi:hypothetical protein
MAMSTEKAVLILSAIVAGVAALASCVTASASVTMSPCAWRPDSAQADSVRTTLAPPVVRVGEIWPPRGPCGTVLDINFERGGVQLKVLLDDRASALGYRVKLLSGSLPCGAMLPDSIFCPPLGVEKDAAWWGQLVLHWPLCEQAIGRARFAVSVQAVDRIGNTSAPSDTVWVSNRCTGSGGPYK